MSRVGGRKVPVSAPTSGDAVTVMPREGEPAAATLARARLDPALSAAVTLRAWTQNQFAGEWSSQPVVDELKAQAEAASRNDLTRLEAILTTQAHVLDALFNTLARRSARNLDAYPDAVERYMRLALKAQGQCRATIETLAEIKNPKPVAFVRQANIAAGHQQVNNLARAEGRNSANEILEGVNDEERLEQGPQRQTVLGHSSLAAVGTRNGTEDPRGEGAVSAEQPQARRLQP